MGRPRARLDPSSLSMKNPLSLPFSLPSVGIVSLGCPKNLVDTEVMLGHLAARGLDADGSGEIARRHREHVRLHRFGQGGVRRGDPPRGGAEGGGGDRPRRRGGLHGAEVREGARRRDSRGGPLHRSRRAGERSRRGAGPAVASALHREAARDAPLRRARAARPHATQGLRVPEGLRGLQQPLHVLHDPPDARPHALADGRVAREGGAGARGAGRQGARPHLAGHDAIRRGPRPRPDGPHGARDGAPRGDVVPVDPLPLRVPEDAPRLRLRAHGEGAAFRPVRRHAAPARLAEDPRRDEERRRRGELPEAVRGDPRDRPGHRAPLDVHRRVSRERKTKISWK